MNKESAFNQFWNSFGLTFYDETSVPVGAAYPYGTYEAAFDGFGDSKIALDASLWYTGRSWESAMLKTEQIYKSIGVGGVTVPYDGGMLWVTRRTPFARRLGDDSNDQIRRVVLGINIEFVDSK